MVNNLFKNAFLSIIVLINFGMHNLNFATIFFRIIDKYINSEPILFRISSNSISIFFVKKIFSFLFFSCIINIFSYNSFDKLIIPDKESSELEVEESNVDSIIYNLGSEIPINSLKFLKLFKFLVFDE